MNEAEKKRRDEVMAKVQKLLNMTVERGASENEAANAARIAQRLMAEYQLSICDLERGSVGEEVQRLDLPAFGDRGGWEATMLHNIALAFACRVVNCSDKLALFGHTSDVQVVVYYYYTAVAQLLPQAQQAALAVQKKQRQGYVDSFMVGAGNAIRERLAAQRTAPEASAQEKALVPLDAVKKELVEKMMREAFPNLGRGWGPRTNYAAQERGRQAGNSISLNKGISTVRQGGSGPLRLT